MRELITILRTTDHRRRACKSFGQGTAKGYDLGSWFIPEQRGISSLEELCHLLTALEADTSAFLIRGALLSHLAPNTVVRRRANGQDAAFRECPRRFTCVDIDRVLAPPELNPTSEEALAFVIKQLPPEFHEASFVYTFSSSAGIDPSGKHIKAHLFFELDRPMGDRDMRAWAKATGIADPAIYNPVQPIYTAAPLFVEGRVDPFANKRRTGYVTGRRTVVDLQLRKLGDRPKAATLRAAQRGDVTDNSLAIDGRERLLVDIRWRHLQDAPNLQEFVDRVWAEFVALAELGSTIASDNNYTFEKVAEACARDWRKHSDIQPERARPVLTAVEAAQRLRLAIKSAIRAKGSSVICATAGLGKTTVTAQELVAMPGISESYVEIYAPFRQSQRDWKDYLDTAALRAGKPLAVSVVEGRAEDNCIHSDLAGKLARSGLPITSTLCRGCARFETCSYLQQFMSRGPGIRIFSHAHLTTQRPKQWSTPQVVIVDESFHGALIDTSGDISPKAIGALIGIDYQRLLHDLGGGPVVATILATARTVAEAIEDKAPLLAALRNAGRTSADLAAFAELLQSYVEYPHLGRSAAELSQGLVRSTRASALRLIELLKALAQELRTDRTQAHSVLATDRGFTFCRRKPARRLCDVETLIILDADHERENLLPIVGEHAVHEIRACENYRIAQIEDRSMSRQYLGVRAGQAFPKAEDVDRIVDFVRGNGTDPKLVVTYKAMVPVLEPLMSEVHFAHFGGLRGTNKFKDCSTIFIVGRQYLPTEAVETQARALHFDAPKPLIFAAPVRRRYQVGRGVLCSYDEPDERLLALRRSGREAESRQAIARLRGVHAIERKHVYLLSSQPVGVNVDRLMQFVPVIALSVFHENHFLPLRDKELTALAPQKFASHTAARNWLRRPENSRGALTTLFKRTTAFIALTTYRARNSRGRKSTLIVNPTLHPFPERSLAKRLDAVVDPLPWIRCADPPPLPGVGLYRLGRCAE